MPPISRRGTQRTPSRPEAQRSRPVPTTTRLAAAPPADQASPRVHESPRIHAPTPITRKSADQTSHGITRNRSFSPPPKFKDPLAIRKIQIGVTASGKRQMPARKSARRILPSGSLISSLPSLLPAHRGEPPASQPPILSFFRGTTLPLPIPNRIEIFRFLGQVPRKALRRRSRLRPLPPERPKRLFDRLPLECGRGALPLVFQVVDDRGRLLAGEGRQTVPRVIVKRRRAVPPRIHDDRLPELPQERAALCGDLDRRVGEPVGLLEEGVSHLQPVEQVGHQVGGKEEPEPRL